MLLTLCATILMGIFVLSVLLRKAVFCFNHILIRLSFHVGGIAVLKIHWCSQPYSKRVPVLCHRTLGVDGVSLQKTMELIQSTWKLYCCQVY